MSLEHAYEALRTFEILGIGKDLDISTSTCTLITENFKDSSARLKDINFAFKLNRALKCKVDEENFKAISSTLQAAITKANSLLDFYYAVGSLLLLKDHAAHLDVQLDNADQLLRSVKALGQSDGRWRYSSSKPDSGTRAAGKYSPYEIELYLHVHGQTQSSRSILLLLLLLSLISTIRHVTMNLVFFSILQFIKKFSFPLLSTCTYYIAFYLNPVHNRP
ncbi:hypothetical protein BVRB_6g146250 [Beta vulgaris subsp. vulgaris]|nr:hypothetical protein BVRB_6g146250 [Beta vulgaris subsp. vulgaris]